MSPYRPCTSRVTVAAAVCTALLAVGMPSANADQATDALGFVDSTARCAAPNTAVAFGSTAELAGGDLQEPSWSIRLPRCADQRRRQTDRLRLGVRRRQLRRQKRRHHLHGDVDCAGGQRRQRRDSPGTNGVVPRTGTHTDRRGRRRLPRHHRARPRHQQQLRRRSRCRRRYPPRSAESTSPATPKSIGSRCNCRSLRSRVHDRSRCS